MILTDETLNVAKYRDTISETKFVNVTHQLGHGFTIQKCHQLGHGFTIRKGHKGHKTQRTSSVLLASPQL